MANSLYDLRNYNNYRTAENGDKTHTNYSLNDINFSMYIEADPPKMVIAEFQPTYPTYYESLGKIGVNIIAGLDIIIGKLGGEFTKTLIRQAAQSAGKTSGNTLIDELSYNPSALYTAEGGRVGEYNINTMGRFLNLFKATSLGSYEVPFNSLYFDEADGISGWETGDASRSIGRQLNEMIAENINMNWPTTPNWAYSPQYPSVDFEFKLINDSAENLAKNLKFLVAFLSGMRYVQVATLYKSPNVYDVCVPGRFRWYWSAISAKVECMGKFIDDGNLGLLTALSNPHPEAFNVRLTVKSLVPNCFNTYIYYLMNGSVRGKATGIEDDVFDTVFKTLTEATEEKLKDVAKKVGSALTEAFK